MTSPSSRTHEIARDRMLRSVDHLEDLSTEAAIDKPRCLLTWGVITTSSPGTQYRILTTFLLTPVRQLGYRPVPHEQDQSSRWFLPDGPSGLVAVARAEFRPHSLNMAAWISGRTNMRFPALADAGREPSFRRASIVITSLPLHGQARVARTAVRHGPAGGVALSSIAGVPGHAPGAARGAVWSSLPEGGRLPRSAWRPIARSH